MHLGNLPVVWMSIETSDVISIEVTVSPENPPSSTMHSGSISLMNVPSFILTSMEGSDSDS